MSLQACDDFRGNGLYIHLPHHSLDESNFFPRSVHDNCAETLFQRNDEIADNFQLNGEDDTLQKTDVDAGNPRKDKNQDRKHDDTHHRRGVHNHSGHQGSHLGDLGYSKDHHIQGDHTESCYDKDCNHHKDWYHRNLYSHRLLYLKSFP